MLRERDTPHTASADTDDERGLLEALIGDGLPLLAVTALALLFAGGFALFLTVTRQFLPHDIAYLQVSATELCALADCRVTDFMLHDRAAFGGALIAIGVLYLWLIAFPLRGREPWAWWTVAVTGFVGFLSFLAYFGYGYLDTWHGTATLFLLPCFLLGLARSYPRLRFPRDIRRALRNGAPAPWTSRFGIGRLLLLATAGGMIAGGGTILVIGTTSVFVPQDLAFMGVMPEQLHAANPRLVPLIAHDRAGFGGGILSTGLIVALCTWCGTPSRSLWEAFLIAGTAGFGCAIGVHLLVGYTDLTHLGPAVAGAFLFAVGLLLTRRGMLTSRGRRLRTGNANGNGYR
jgi:hypothetical protein